MPYICYSHRLSTGLVLRSKNFTTNNFLKPLWIQYLTSVMKLTIDTSFALGYYLGLLSLSEKLAHESIAEMAHESFDFPSGRMTQLARTFAVFRSL